MSGHNVVHRYRFVHLFLAILIVLMSAGPRSAYAIDDGEGGNGDPGGDIEAGCTTSKTSPLPGVFRWGMRPRTGVDKDNNNLVDLPNTYEYANPGAFSVYLTYDCVDDARIITSFQWTIKTLNDAVVATAAGNPAEVSLPEGAYNAQMVATLSNGKQITHSERMTVKDWLIVSIGDSYGSGEGNPALPQLYDALGFVSKGAQWFDGKEENRRCHRSPKAGSAEAARELEYADSKSSVTFIFVACSGATINTPDPEGKGTGILGEYCGIELTGGKKCSEVTYLRPQIEQVKNIVGDRKIDALIISGGGNDVGFANIVKSCVLDVMPQCFENKGIVETFNKQIGLLPGLYDDLNARINSDLNVSRVYLTEYPDPVRSEDRDFCRNSTIDPLLFGMTRSENAWASNYVGQKLNEAVHNAATNINNAHIENNSQQRWTAVGNIAEQFRSYGGVGHGYCTSDANRWMRTSVESVTQQGPLNLGVPKEAVVGGIIGPIALPVLLVYFTVNGAELAVTKGTMHPNAAGHQAYKRAILDTMRNATFGYTPKGSPVHVTPGDPENDEHVDIIFDNVQSPGLSTVEIDGYGPSVPVGYIGSTNQTYYNIETSATMTPGTGATVCIAYDDAGMTPSQESYLRLTHYIGSGWEDQTILPVNTDSNEICARTTSFSPFAIFRKNAPPVADAGPATLIVDEGVAAQLNGSATDPDGDALTYSWTPADNLSNATIANPTFTASDNGQTTLTLTVKDSVGNEAQDTITITANNVAPVADFVAPASVGEGSSFTLSLRNVYDVAADMPTLQFAFDCGTGYGSFGSATSATCPTSDNGKRNVRVSLKDKDNGVREYTSTVDVVNLPPVLTISGPAEGTLYAVNTEVKVSASFTDKGTDDTHTCVIDWDNNGIVTPGIVQQAAGSGTCQATYTFTAAGVYTIRMTATDDDGASDSKTVMVVVYDPSAGFVTGGGSINSPRGACKLNSLCQNAEGKASFGFVSKYQKGATTPTGKTEFKFQAGNFSFNSENYEWLVVAGSKAQYKGTGSVNGTTGYGFLLTAVDGSSDKFRIKIWNASGQVVYDNKPSASDDIDNVDPQIIDSGSIVIHTGK